MRYVPSTAVLTLACFCVVVWIYVLDYLFHLVA
jgi:diacylglycerol kinase